MNKHRTWLDATQVFSTFSKCPRQQFSAVIVDSDNQVVSVGYNGNIRGQYGDLCGGDECLRDTYSIPSGKDTDIGCIHAEENAILNCARQGVSCIGTTLYINGEPCPKCCRRIAQVGIHRVVYCKKGYPIDGLNILKENGVETILMPMQIVK